MNETSPNGSKLLVVFDDHDVDHRQHTILSAPLAALARAGSTEELRALRGVVEARFLVYGRTEPIYLDADVRRMAADLRRALPGWFFFFSLSGQGLLGLTYALLENVRVVGRTGDARVDVEYPADEFEGLFMEMAGEMRAIHDRAGLDEADFERRLADLSRYFGLEAEDWDDGGGDPAEGTNG